MKRNNEMSERRKKIIWKQMKSKQKKSDLISHDKVCSKCLSSGKKNMYVAKH